MIETPPAQYAAELRNMKLQDIGRDLFVIAKANEECDQWKITLIYEELVRRDLPPFLQKLKVTSVP